jgi:hypothetical protein
MVFGEVGLTITAVLLVVQSPESDVIFPETITGLWPAQTMMS